MPKISGAIYLVLWKLVQSRLLQYASIILLYRRRRAALIIDSCCVCRLWVTPFISRQFLLILQNTFLLSFQIVVIVVLVHGCVINKIGIDCRICQAMQMLQFWLGFFWYYWWLFQTFTFCRSRCVIRRLQLVSRGRLRVVLLLLLWRLLSPLLDFAVFEPVLVICLGASEIFVYLDPYSSLFLPEKLVGLGRPHHFFLSEQAVV